MSRMVGKSHADKQLEAYQRLMNSWIFADREFKHRELTFQGVDIKELFKEAANAALVEKINFGNPIFNHKKEILSREPLSSKNYKLNKIIYKSGSPYEFIYEYVPFIKPEVSQDQYFIDFVEKEKKKYFSKIGIDEFYKYFWSINLKQK